MGNYALACVLFGLALLRVVSGWLAKIKDEENLVDIPIVFGLTLITFQLFAARLPFVYSARDML